MQATVISLVPFVIQEFKPGIYPGFFEIAPAVKDIPQVLVVGDSVYHVEVDAGRSVTVKCPAEDVAKSIVEDYLTSNLEFDNATKTYPALFWKPGVFTQGEAMTKLSTEIQAAKEAQIRWFKRLVALADDDWSKTGQHKFISDMQRYACKYLELERPWIINTRTDAGQVKCPSCTTFVSIDAIVCHNCRCILKMTEYKKLNFVEVK